jgi:aldose 1-epimerase
MYDDIFEREKNPHYGATVGRVAGKIRDAKYKLPNGKEVELKRPPFHENGGTYGYSRFLWEKTEIVKDVPLDITIDSVTKTGTGIKFTHTSFDKEEGFLGKVEVECSYLMTDDDELHIKWKAWLHEGQDPTT